MTRCIFCGKEFEAVEAYDLPLPLEDSEVIKQICPECMHNLCNALRARGWR